MLTIGFVLLVLIVFVTLAAIACHVALIPLLRLLAGVSPEARSYCLLLVAAAPWLIGTGVLASSLGDIWFGACDFASACLWNEDPTLMSPWRAIAVVPLLAALGIVSVTTFRQILASRRAVATLRAVSTPYEDKNIQVVPNDAAFAFAGRGQVFVSQSLKNRLPPREYQAVLLHEQAHLERRDALFQTIAAVLTASYLPPFRKRLLTALALANEQSCDRYAALFVGPETTAAAILAVERMASGPVMPMLPGLVDGFVPVRVHRLLDQSRPTIKVGLASAALPLAIVLAFLGADILYYLGMLFLFPAL